MTEQRTDETGDDCRIGPVGILSPSEDVEVAEPDAVDTVEVVKYIGVQFIDVFGDGIRRERFADLFFRFTPDSRAALSILTNPPMLTSLVVTGSWTERGTEPRAAS